MASLSTRSLDDLENIIKMALKKTGAQKEWDLCTFLSSETDSLSPSEYLKLKDTSRDALADMIKERILYADLYKPPQKVQMPSESPYAGPPLEECIKAAMVKVNVLRETALCKYIPSDEGYIHHFSFLKMKSANPVQLRNLIKQYILDRQPVLIPPKKRNRKGISSEGVSLSSRNNVNSTSFQSEKHNDPKSDGWTMPPPSTNHNESPDKSAVDQLLHMVDQLMQMIQVQEAILRLALTQKQHFDCFFREKLPRRIFPVIQNLLIEKIRCGQVDQDLWKIFAEMK